MRRTPMPPDTVPLLRKTPMARTPLSRSPWDRKGSVTPLVRKNAPGKKGPAVGAASGQRKPPGEFTPAVKLIIRTRAGNGDPAQARCEAHGDFLGEHGGEFQHRQARGMGGSRSTVKNSAANGTLICPAAHRVCEARDKEMHEHGFWLEQWQDPRTEPILLASPSGSGVKAWLTADGGYSTTMPEVAA